MKWKKTVQTLYLSTSSRNPFELRVGASQNYFQRSNLYIILFSEMNFIRRVGSRLLGRGPSAAGAESASKSSAGKGLSYIGCTVLRETAAAVHALERERERERRA